MASILRSLTHTSRSILTSALPQSYFHRSLAVLPLALLAIHSTSGGNCQLPLLRNLYSTSSPASSPITPPTMGSIATPNAADALFDIIKGRRSIYPLTKDLPISRERIQEIVNQAILHTPTSFNSQTIYAVILHGAEHDKLWDLTLSTLKAKLDPSRWEATEQRIAMFKAGAGSILFFEDAEITASLKTKFATYADRFDEWAAHADGMVQFVIWTALEAEGLGANLQHYNPIINDQVADVWGLPKHWKLHAQLVFGGRQPGAELKEKEYKPIEDRVKVFGL